MFRLEQLDHPGTNRYSQGTQNSQWLGPVISKPTYTGSKPTGTGSPRKQGALDVIVHPIRTLAREPRWCVSPVTHMWNPLRR